MAVLLASATLRCRPGRATDPSRAALVIDYRGDDPPEDLLAGLRAAGWRVPTPLAPPADAVDWDHPDASTGRSWTVRPYLVHGAVAVPGDGMGAEDGTVAGLRRTLGAWGITLDETEVVRVATLAEPRGGVTEVLPEPPAPLDVEVPLAFEQPATLPRRTPGWLEIPEPTTPVQAAVLRGLDTARAGDHLDLRTVRASVRPGSVHDALAALDEIGVLEDTSAITAFGAGASGGRIVRYRGQTKVDLDQRVLLEVVVPDHRIGLVVELVQRAVHLGKAGDGVVWVV